MCNEVKKCSKCKRELPIERFSNGNGWCKNCRSTYVSEVNGFMPEDGNVKIEKKKKVVLIYYHRKIKFFLLKLLPTIQNKPHHWLQKIISC